MRGTFYGVGVGPGDPELLTIKAAAVLQKTDYVAVPLSAGDRESAALAISSRHLPPGCRILKLEFPMTRDTLLLEQAWEKACVRVQNQLDRGATVAFLTLGDPMLYSTYMYLYSRLRARGYSVYTVPGVTSFSAAAAAAGIPLAAGEEKLALLPGYVSEEFLLQELERCEAVVLLKVSRCYEKIVATLKKGKILQGSVLVMNCGLPEEKVVTDLSSMLGRRLPYFSLIITGKGLLNR